MRPYPPLQFSLKRQYTRKDSGSLVVVVVTLGPLVRTDNEPYPSKKLSSTGKAMLGGKDLAELPVLKILLRVSIADHDAIQEIRDCGALIHTQAGDVLTCEVAGEVLE